MYWDHLIMAARVSGYYISPFKGYWGFTQGDPLLLKLFNIVVYSAIRQWMMIVEEEAAGT